MTIHKRPSHISEPEIRIKDRKTGNIITFKGLCEAEIFIESHERPQDLYDVKGKSKKKYKSKAQNMWEVSKELEEWFRDNIVFNLTGKEKNDFDELTRLIRGSEYRRGKEDGVNEVNIGFGKERKINESIGELLTKEKYKFLTFGLVGEICRDFIREYDK